MRPTPHTNKWGNDWSITRQEYENHIFHFGILYLKVEKKIIKTKLDKI